MKETIVICGHSLTAGGLQRIAGLASLALSDLGYDIVHLLNETEPVDYAHAGLILPENINMPEARQAVARARLIFDFGYRGKAVTPFLRFLAEHAPGKVIPTANNTLTVGNYLDVHHDLGLLHQALAVLCLSQAVRAAAERRYGPLPNARVMYSAIDPRLSPGSSLIQIHPRPYFLFVGRASIHHKGLDYLITAWGESGLSVSHDLLLLGVDPPPDELSALITASGVDTSVHCLPFTNNVAPWMAQSVALVLASRHEGLGMVLPEALHCGTPCVATRCGGPEEVIRDGVNGFLVDVGDTRSFAAAMKRMAHEPGLRARLAAAAPASVGPFLYSAHVRAWEELMTDLGVYQSPPSANTPALAAPFSGIEASSAQAAAPPAVSVQLPVYNKARYLRECLDSIIGQTMTDFEVIAVDDGSTDGSWDILQEYAARDPRFRLFRHEINLGTLAARKRCFIEARGDYMAFIDADDLAKPNMLAHLHSLTEGSTDLVQSAARINNSEQTITSELAEQYDRFYTHVVPVQFSGVDVFRNLKVSIKMNLWLTLASRNVYRAILPHIPDEQLPHGNDNLLMLMLAFFSNSYRNTDQVLYNFRANPSSSNLILFSPDKALEHIESRARAMRCAEEFLRQVTPNCDWSQPPYPQIIDSYACYPAQIVARCIERNPASRDSLVSAYQRAFGDSSKKHMYLIPANAAVGMPSPPAPTAPLKQAFMKRLRAAVRHRWEAKRLRRSGLFFSDWYLDRNPDVKAAGIDPLVHYLAHGAREGRNPNPLFVSAWYLRANPDVASSGINPLLHYRLHGWRENRSPSPHFNVIDYLRLRPDVAAKGAEPLQHYLLHGIAEGMRFPVPNPPTPKLQVANPAVQKFLPLKPLVSRPVEPKIPSPPAGSATTLASNNPNSLPSDSLASEPKISASGAPVLKLSTLWELGRWYHLYTDFIELREKMERRSEKDYRNAKLKLIQDLAIIDFISKNLRPGARILEIGGGYSRVLAYFKDRFDGWNLDKFAGIGNGPKEIQANVPYMIVPDYIGAFNKDLPSGSFDFVFSISVFEHIQGDVTTMNGITADIGRLLKPDGLEAHCMDCRFPPAGLSSRLNSDTRLLKCPDPSIHS